MPPRSRSTTTARVVVAAERLAPYYLRDGDDVRIDALFIVPRRWPRHLPNVWQG
jgi:putative endonuclease